MITQGSYFIRRFGNVLIVYSNPSAPNVLRQALMVQTEVSGVDMFDAYRATPSADLLARYRVVVTFSNNAYADAVGFGDRLADFQFAGGIVVASFRSFHDATAIGGRWQREGYAPFENGDVITGYAKLGNYVPHPLLAGVGSMSALFRTDVKLAKGAVQVAKYGDGRPAVAYKVTGGSLAVGLPAFLDDGNGANILGYAAVIANAGRWMGMPAMEYEPMVVGR